MEPFTLNARLPRLKLWDILFLGVHDEHQVLSIQELPWYTSAELARKCFQHQDEEQWAKDSRFAHQPPRQTPHCTHHWHTHNSRHRSTCPGEHAQPIYRHHGSSRPIMGPKLETTLVATSRASPHPPGTPVITTQWSHVHPPPASLSWLPCLYPPCLSPPREGVDSMAAHCHPSQPPAVLIGYSVEIGLKQERGLLSGTATAKFVGGPWFYPHQSLLYWWRHK